MRAPSLVIVALAVLATACGGANDVADEPTTSTAAAEAPSIITTTTTPVTTTSSTTTTTAQPSTTTTELLELAPVESLSSGLFCRDLAGMGYPYLAAAWYWIGDGSPDRMDADGNGVPCETVYPAADVGAFWAGPQNPGWQPVWATWTVQPGCCSNPTTGPASPAGSIPRDAWPADGFYSAVVDQVDGSTLTLLLQRRVTCAELPDGCMFDWPSDALATDPTSGVERTLDLTSPDVGVVVRPINGASDGWFGALQGTGEAFARLIALLDSSPPLVRPWFGWPDAVEGPFGTFLTETWWITSLEIRNGAPVLWVWAGQIAG